MDRQNKSSRPRKKQKHLKENPNGPTDPIPDCCELTEEGTYRLKADIQKYVNDNRLSLEKYIKAYRYFLKDVEKKANQSPHAPHYLVRVSDHPEVTSALNVITYSTKSHQKNNPPKELKKIFDELEPSHSAVSTFRCPADYDVDKLPPLVRLERFVAFGTDESRADLIEKEPDETEKNHDIPSDCRTRVVSKQEVAHAWGKMKVKKLTSLMTQDKMKLHYIEINRESFVFDIRDLPPDVVEKLK